ncbi:unnamed protein product, partial [Brachionus calyciflorus]
MEIKIGGWTGMHNFVISESLQGKEAIIGRDFLKVNKVDCTLLYEYSLIPRCQRTVCLKVETNTLAKEVVFTPTYGDLKDEGVYLAHSVNAIEDGIIYVTVINTNPYQVTLKKGTIMGFVDGYHDLFAELYSTEGQTTSSDSGKPSNEEINKLVDKDDVGRTHLIKHSIDTGDNGPIRKRQFRIPHAVQPELDKQVDELLKNGLIEESASPWCTPVMLAKQVGKNGQVKFRFLADMREINKITKKDCYPLPRIDQALDSLGGAKYFTGLDMARSYFQVPLREEDKEKTAFCVNNKLYQWKVMPQGLTNAPATFSRLMNLVLNGLTHKHCLVYLDDLIIYSRTFNENLAHLNEILDRLIAAGLKLKPGKCQFASNRVSYLGFVVSENGVEPYKEKVKSYPDFSRTFVIQTDASQVAVGAVIGQFDNNKKFRPISYSSRHLTGAETRYSATERELLAIVEAKKKNYALIYGRKVLFVTDHQPLVTMKNLKEPMGRIGRLLHKLQDIDYEIVYQPGKENFTADLLSRPENVDVKAQVNAVEMDFISALNWQVEQDSDDEMFRVKEVVSGGRKFNFMKWSGINRAKEWYRYCQDLVCKDGVLFHVGNGLNKRVVPAS